MKAEPTQRRSETTPEAPGAQRERPAAQQNPVWQRLAIQVQAAPADGDPSSAAEREAERVAQEVSRSAPGDSGMPFPASRPTAHLTDASGLKPRENAEARPLGKAERSYFEPRMGRDFGDVRIHDGPRSARLAARLGARAFTFGRSIVFGPGAYGPGTAGGRHLLAHELAHVAQQEAGGTRVVQRFEAGVHESVERYALTTRPGQRGALTQEEAGAAYFGNWMRDMNQVFVPLVTDTLNVPPDLVFSVLSFLAFKKFGRFMTPEQFGFYIPSEHVDSPAGLIPADLLQSPPAISPSASQGTGPPRDPQFVTPQEPVGPQATVRGAPLFAVDQTGTMAFIRRTNLHVERRLEQATGRGRTHDGLLHFGAALHAIEDLFAHSNWIEIAVSKVLRDDPALLPSLTGAQREVFTFTPTVVRGEEERPVLTTGSFLGADTMISIGSEVVTQLRAGLPPPGSDEEARAQQQVITNLLRVLTRRLRSDATFRAAIRRILVEQTPLDDVPLVGDELVDRTLDLPLDQIYEWTRIPFIPRWVKDAVGLTSLQGAIRDAVNAHALAPLADQLETVGIETDVAETSLIEQLRTSRDEAAGRFAPATQARMRAIERAGGPSRAQQRREARATARARVTTLEATPEAVVAGPSHSQLAKDHPSSPFFGLAFQLAAVADRRLRDRMIAAWDEAAGGRTAPLRPSTPPTDPGQLALYRQRGTAATAARRRGARIAARGRELPAAAYDLDRMRLESARDVRAVAGGLRAVAGAPDQAADAAEQLRSAIGGIDHEWIDGAREALRAAAVALRGAGRTVDRTAELRPLADRLDSHAGEIEGPPSGAPTLDQRHAANVHLRADRAAAIRILAAAPAVDSATAAIFIAALNRQVMSTAVSYTPEQRDVVEGRRHVLAPSSTRALPNATVRLPSLAGRSPALRRLLDEARTILDHPYEDSWWVSTVRQFIRAHPGQIQEEIEARNAGYPLFRPPGAPPGHH